MTKLTRDQKIAAMKSSPLLSAVGETDLARFLDICVDRLWRKGAIVFSQGEAAEAFFVILWGKVKVFQTSIRGDEQILHLYGRGDTFAEAAMWAGGVYPAQAQAVEDSSLLVVTRSALRAAIAKSPELAMGIIAGMSSKLKEFNELIEQLSLREIPARLAASLVRESRRAGARTFRLSQTKRQLASQVGTVPETLSRSLAKLKARGLISVKGSQITILDPKGLEAAARGEDDGRQ